MFALIPELTTEAKYFYQNIDMSSSHLGSETCAGNLIQGLELKTSQKSIRCIANKNTQFSDNLQSRL